MMSQQSFYFGPNIINATLGLSTLSFNLYFDLYFNLYFDLYFDLSIDLPLFAISMARLIC